MRLVLTDLWVDLESRVVHGGPDHVVLTATEAAVLTYLAQRADRDVSREELLREVWGHQGNAVTRTVDTTVRRLRAKVEREPSEPRHLLTAYRFGYRFRGLDAALPALGVTNVDADEEPIVGRSDAWTRLVDQLDRHRLVTLVGPSGVGKSRLVRECRRLLDRFPGGVWQCGLEQVHDRAGVVRSVGEALGVPLRGDGVDQLGRALAARGPVLLVLDAVAAVADEVASLVARWLAVAPELHALMVAGRPMSAEGEVIARLEPLDLPAATELFLGWARRKNPRFASRPGDDRAVQRIVEHLDRLPLALELASARAAVLSASALADRLADGTTGSPDALQVVLDASWAELDEEARTTLAQCAVFEGPFTASDAQAVVDLPREAVLRALEGLAERSLVLPTDGAERLLLLGLVRRHAEANGDPAALASTWERHRTLRLAQAEHRATQSGDPEVRAWFAAHHGDLLAVWRRFAASDPAVAIRAAIAADVHLHVVGPSNTRRTLLDAALALGTEGEVSARLRNCRGLAAIADGDLDGAHVELVAVHSDHPPTEARRLSVLALVLDLKGQRAEAWAASDRALRIAQTAGEVGLVAVVLSDRGALARARGDLDGAVAALHGALLLVPPTDLHLQIAARCNLGNTYLDQGALDAAAGCFEEAAALNERLGSPRVAAQICLMQGSAAMVKGALPSARRFYDDALSRNRALGQDREVAVTLGNLGWLGLLEGDYGAARRHLDAARAAHEATGNRRSEALVRGNLGVLQLLTGALPSAILTLSSALVSLGPIAPRESGYVACYLAAARADAADLTGAELALNAARAHFDGTGDPAAPTHLALAIAHLELARSTAGASALRRSDPFGPSARLLAEIDANMHPRSADTVLAARLLSHTCDKVRARVVGA